MADGIGGPEPVGSLHWADALKTACSKVYPSLHIA